MKTNRMTGLLVYDSIYGSTVEVAYWIKAIIGHDQHLDVKDVSQVITVKPYDYVIIGSCARWEKPRKKVYEFVEEHREELAQKKVCYYLTTADCDETLLVKPPASAPYLIGGRNYLMHIQRTFPEIKPVAIGGFWLWRTIAREGAAFKKYDIWETLVVERVEAFANEVRTGILRLPPREDVYELRTYWTSLQPANLTNAALKKFRGITYEEHESKENMLYARTRAEGDLGSGTSFLKAWANRAGIDLREQVRTSYNVYYHAVKDYRGKEVTTHVVTATLPEDPGNVHFSFRCYKKRQERRGVEKDVELAREILGGR
jgi:menaquinone-dependent protoporphyrinogen IX oxidase